MEELRTEPGDVDRRRDRGGEPRLAGGQVRFDNEGHGVETKPGDGSEFFHTLLSVTVEHASTRGGACTWFDDDSGMIVIHDRDVANGLATCGRGAGHAWPRVRPQVAFVLIVPTSMSRDVYVTRVVEEPVSNAPR